MRIVAMAVVAGCAGRPAPHGEPVAIAPYRKLLFVDVIAEPSVSAIASAGILPLDPPTPELVAWGARFERELAAYAQTMQIALAPSTTDPFDWLLITSCLTQSPRCMTTPNPSRFVLWGRMRESSTGARTLDLTLMDGNDHSVATTTEPLPDPLVEPSPSLAATMFDAVVRVHDEVVIQNRLAHGAVVAIDGSLRRLAPAELAVIKLARGPHRVRIDTRGFEAWQDAVVVDGQHPVRLCVGAECR